MDLVQRRGPWTTGPCFVLTPSGSYGSHWLNKNLLLIKGFYNFMNTICFASVNSQLHGETIAFLKCKFRKIVLKVLFLANWWARYNLWWGLTGGNVFFINSSLHFMGTISAKNWWARQLPMFLSVMCFVCKKLQDDSDTSLSLFSFVLWSLLISKLTCNIARVPFRMHVLRSSHVRHVILQWFGQRVLDTNQ